MKRMLIVLVVVLSISVLFAANVLAKDNDDTLEKIVNAGVVKVGFFMDVPPIKFRDANNEPAGVCVDFSKALARDLGVKLEFVYSEWAALIPTLLSGRSDLLIVDMSATLERAKKVNFTDPWLVTGSYVVVKSESGIESWEELNKDGVKIACQLGTVGVEDVKKNIPKAEEMIYSTVTELQLALEQGRVDALVQDLLLVSRMANKSEGKLKLLPNPLENDVLAFTLRPDDFHLLTWMNLWLKTLKSSGEYDEIMNYWIFTDEWEKDYPGF
jgi:polar amino acid transport system substrate-binding protein